jgi:Na+-transporting methylmalonyl-CoA/oxaloacetate decarboxylase gamma subunit
MFEFDQYLGFLAFMTIVTMGFWLMFLMLLVVIPYWVVGALIESINELLQERKAKKQLIP